MSLELQLRIGTFNIRNNRAILDGRHYWWLRRSATRAAIESLDADIVGLQEVRPLQLRYLRRRLTQYRFLTAGRDNGKNRGEHCSVLVNPYRFDIESYRVRWFSPTPDIPGTRYAHAPQRRICTMTQLRDRQSQFVFGVVNAHVEAYPVEFRQQAIAQLADWLAATPLPWIVMGDFNCSIDEPDMQSLWSAGYCDALHEIPARGEGAASFHTFTGTCDGYRIDHILMPNSWASTNATIHFDRPFDKLPSDHWPVSVTLLPKQ